MSNFSSENDLSIIERFFKQPNDTIKTSSDFPSSRNLTEPIYFFQGLLTQIINCWGKR